MHWKFPFRNPPAIKHFIIASIKAFHRIVWRNNSSEQFPQNATNVMLSKPLNGLKLASASKAHTQSPARLQSTQINCFINKHRIMHASRVAKYLFFQLICPRSATNGLMAWNFTEKRLITLMQLNCSEEYSFELPRELSTIPGVYYGPVGLFAASRILGWDKTWGWKTDVMILAIVVITRDDGTRMKSLLGIILANLLSFLRVVL